MRGFLTPELCRRIAFNTIASPVKRLVIMEHSDHKGTGGTQTAYYHAQGEWLSAIAKGEVPPLTASLAP